MVYKHRTYYTLPGKMAEFTEACGPTIFHLFEKYGAQFISVWQTAIGQNSKFVYILGFEDLKHQKNFWQDFRWDEIFHKCGQAKPRVDCPISKILRPQSCSPFD
jgi:hypothetical protein